MNKYKIFTKMWFLALLLVTVVAGCASNSKEVDPGELVSVAVSPSLVTIPVTGTQQYTVTAIYRNGSSQDVTSSATLTAANAPAGGTAVATIVSSGLTKGLATGKVIGTSTITATYLGNVATATLTVNAATATKFEVNPVSYSIPVTGTQKFSAIETFSDGTSFDRTAASTWSAVNSPAIGSAVATVGVTTGIATGVRVGTSTITATLGTRSSSATLNVNAASSLSFKVTPALASIPVSGTQQYTVIETFSDGSTIDRTAAAVWSTTNLPLGGTAVATVSNTVLTKGFATGKVVGVATITASFTDALGILHSDSARLNVNAAKAVSFEVTPALATIPVSGIQKYTAIETFEDGTRIDRTAASTWSAPGLVGGFSVATINSTGLATGKVKGSTFITATYAGSTFSPASATLTVNDATTAGFKVTPATATIGITGGGQQFAAIESFSDGSSFDRTLDSVWTSVDLTGGPGVATIGLNDGIATGAAIGTATITATYTVGTVTQTGSAILTVTAPDPGTAGGAPLLGMADTYGILASTAITSSSALSHIYGDVALTTGVIASVTGPNFKDAGAAPNLTSSGVTTSNGVTPGIINTADNGNLSVAQMAQLQSDLNGAYIDLSGRPATTTYPAGAVELSGKVLTPGVYKADTFGLSSIAGPVVLDAQGNPDAVFVLQAGAMTTTTGSVVLQGGAKAKNIFWVITSSATIGGGTFFQGTVVAGNTITVGLNANVQGRMLAGANGAGAITNSGVITVPK